MLRCRHRFPWLSPPSLSLFLHSSLSSITSGRSSRLHPVSVQMMKILLAGQLLHVRDKAFIGWRHFWVWPAVSCISSSSYFGWFERYGSRWPCMSCFVGCCFQDLFNIARTILVQFPSSFFLYTFSQCPCGCIHRVELTQSLLGRNAFFIG